MKKLKRKCLVCGKKLEIIVEDNGKYSGGYYFSDLFKDKKKSKNDVEYWECEKCFNED